jgi:hypothetical protein
MANARQRRCKQETIPELSQSASNNGGTFEDVLCWVRARAIWEGRLDKHRESAVCSESMRLAWDGRQPPRTWSRKQRNVRRWKQRDWEHRSVCDSDLWGVVTSCISVQLIRLPIQNPVYSHSIMWRYSKGSWRSNERVWIGFISLGMATSGGSCECDNEPSQYTKCREFD